MGFMIELDEEDIGTLQSAVENLRAPERTPSIIDAAWRLASKLELMAKDAEAARRLHERSR
jgi:hypothetical protein